MLCILNASMRNRCMRCATSRNLAARSGRACLQGCYKQQNVAVKRCKIGKAADLLSFQQEVTLLSQMRHPGIVSLLAAKALPPGENVLVMTLRPAADVSTCDVGHQTDMWCCLLLLLLALLGTYTMKSLMCLTCRLSHGHAAGGGQSSQCVA